MLSPLSGDPMSVLLIARHKSGKYGNLQWNLYVQITGVTHLKRIEIANDILQIIASQCKGFVVNKRSICMKYIKWHTKSGRGDMQGRIGWNDASIFSTDTAELLRSADDPSALFLEDVLLFLGVSACFMAFVDCRDACCRLAFCPRGESVTGVTVAFACMW